METQGRMAHADGKPRFVRTAMTARTITAFLGGYAFTAALVSLASRLLPIDPAEAVVWAMTFCSLIYAGVALWCFHEPRLGRVVAIVWGMAIAAGLATWLLGTRA